MRVAQFIEAANAVRNIPALDEVSRLVWRALAEGQLTEADAEAATEAVEAQRLRLKARAALSPSLAATSRRRPVSPDKRKSIERRRSLAASGALPPALALNFTQAELAALSIIARQVQKRGSCDLPIDAIAAMAGTCRSVVQNALRHARRLGVLSVQERRRAGQKSDTNLVTIRDGGWLAWLRIGGRVYEKKLHDYRGIETVQNGDTGTSFRGVPGPFRAPSHGRQQKGPPCPKSSRSASAT